MAGSGVALQSNPIIWKEDIRTWVSITLCLVLLYTIFESGLSYMVQMWDSSEEYSYGYLIPIISLFLIWQRSDQLAKFQNTGSWFGVVLALFGSCLFLVGELATLYIIVQYAFVIVLAGLALTFLGWKSFKLLMVPLLILLFMIPLPNFIYQGLSSQLQLISSEIGVWVIELFGISVNLEGNVIDLGVYKLQVVEACSGLRYLFPLLVFGFITAYFYNAPMWKRVFIFLSTIPITVLMNSFRIGVIGVTVEYWGISMAEGFLHDFEGWVIFMACTLVLMFEMWVLTKIGSDKRPLREVFGMDFPQPAPKGAEIKYRKLPAPFWAGVGLLVVTAVVALSLPNRIELEQPRTQLIHFPLTVDQWAGSTDRLSNDVIDALKFDDYLMINYANQSRDPVNFYVAYYDSQRKGQSAHSPRSCIPGGGWQITDLQQVAVEGVEVNGVLLNANRVLIKNGEYTQLVYYWFQQRGRVITNEYLVKWYLFWDSLTVNRSDGALVRLTTSIQPGQDASAGDEILTQFAQDIVPRLEAYIPN